MSQEMMNKQTGEADINRVANQNGVRKDYEGFEGMNYEQIRQPYNPKHRNRNNSNKEDKGAKGPEQG